MLVELKLSRKHPANSMRLGRHEIGIVFSAYDLNDSEQKELESNGGLHWFEKKQYTCVKDAKDFFKEESKKPSTSSKRKK